MTQQSSNPETRTATGVALWSSVLTAALGAISLGIAFATPPKSGPLAEPSVALAFPYAQAAQHVPRDFVWMYPSILFLFAFLALCVSMHALAEPRHRVFGTLGLCMATMSVAIVALNYLVQLQTVQPAILQGEAESVAAISQFNPHGLFITMETMGFLVMSLSLSCFALTLGSSRLERVVAWIFHIAAGLSVATLIGMWSYFGFELEYIYEITVISIVWLALIVSGALLAIAFRRRLASNPALPVPDQARSRGQQRQELLARNR